MVTLEKEILRLKSEITETEKQLKTNFSVMRGMSGFRMLRSFFSVKDKQKTSTGIFSSFSSNESVKNFIGKLGDGAADLAAYAFERFFRKR